MTITLVTSGLGSRFGGIGVVSGMLAHVLAQDGHVTVWRHLHRWPTAIRAAALLAQAALRGSRPEVVLYEHVDLARLHAWPSLADIDYGVFLHGTEVWRPLTARRRRALERARFLLANSNVTVRLARICNPWLPPVDVTWLGVPRVAQQPQRTPQPLAVMLGRMASHERYKGHDQVLSAWPAIKRAVPEAALTIVGGGDDAARLRARAAAESLESVKFLGFVDDATKADLLSRCAVVLAPSLREGFGLAAVEAAAHGAAVVGLQGTAIEELMSGNGVVLAAAQTPAAIAAAATPLLGDLGLALALGARARTHVEAELLEEHFGSRVRAALVRHGVRCGRP